MCAGIRQSRAAISRRHSNRRASITGLECGGRHTLTRDACKSLCFLTLTFPRSILQIDTFVQRLGAAHSLPQPIATDRNGNPSRSCRIVTMERLLTDFDLSSCEDFLLRHANSNSDNNEDEDTQAVCRPLSVGVRQQERWPIASPGGRPGENNCCCCFGRTNFRAVIRPISLSPFRSLACQVTGWRKANATQTPQEKLPLGMVWGKSKVRPRVVTC